MNKFNTNETLTHCLPVFKVVIDVTNGIDKMSLVTFPAVESDFIAMSKQQTRIAMSLDEEQHIVMGVALRCNYPIYRVSPSYGEYFVVFDKEAIRSAYEKFMHHPNRVNLQHRDDVEGVYLIQSYIKDAAAGIDPIQFKDIEDGSWIVCYKVENEEVWSQIKSGEFRGFSVEGWFDLQETDMEIEMEMMKEDADSDDKDLVDEILDSI